jgi:site-specific DNA-methyltransferase (adenine-specific)
MNQLYYGENLDILVRYVEDESVDLVYLDPPFKSNQDYNILFKEQDGTRSPAQIRAFEDTWTWDQISAAAYEEVVEKGGEVGRVLQAFRDFLGRNDMLAYLSMIAPRLVELRRVLKRDGSLYFHCDPSAGHYLKILLDAVFGPTRFLNEIIWKRTHAHGASRRYGPVHDLILFYSRGDDYLWTNARMAHDPEYIEKHFKLVDKDGARFQAISLTGAGVRYGESGKPWKGIDPTKVGRHWALSGEALAGLDIEGIEHGTVQERLDALDDAGLIYWPDK